MDDPTTTTTPTAPPPTSSAPTSTATSPTTPSSTATPAPTAASVKADLDQLRQRAADLHAAADRAESVRYAERGGALDDATRAARSARQEADHARQQAQHERQEAQTYERDAADLEETGRQPGADTRFANEMAARNHALARAAAQRAERLERAAEEQGTRADELDRQVNDLRSAADDYSVASTIREAAIHSDSAVDQLQQKVDLLTNAESLEKDAADLDAQGDHLSADLYRDQVADLRTQADAIQPDIPQLDPRVLQAAGVAWGDETGGQPAPTPPVDPTQGPSGPMVPVDPYAPVDADGDGLSDEFEGQLGTNPQSADTDGDGYTDGIEAAVRIHNPRVREAEDLDAEDVQAKADAITNWEQRHGVEHNADTDGDGVADWVEGMSRSLGGPDFDAPNFTADAVTHNLSPIDQFVRNAQDQIGKPYQFGAEVDSRQQSGDAFDSSELVEWAAKRAGVRDMPDGSWNQYRHLHDAGATVSVDEALQTKGALVFGFSSDPLESTDRPARAYVGISLGNGKILDVSERAGEVREMDPGNFYNYGAVIPQLHRPEGDLDGDGWTDQEEMGFGGDPSRSIPYPRDPAQDIVVPVEDGDGTGATDGSTDAPADAPTDGSTDAPVEDDPTGASRYQGEDDQLDTPPPGTEPDGFGNPSDYWSTPGSGDPADPPAYGDPTDAGDPSGYGDPTGAGAGAPAEPSAPDPADYGVPAAPAEGSYDDGSGGGTGEGSYDDSYSDVSGSYD